MARIALTFQVKNPLAKALLSELDQLAEVRDCRFADPRNLPAGDCLPHIHVYIPSFADRDGMLPDLEEAARVLQQLAGEPAERYILLSSALLYGASPRRHTRVAEDYSGGGWGCDPVAKSWGVLESLAKRHLQGKARLVILRPATVTPSPSLLCRRLMAGVTTTVAGHDPLIQLLDVQDLAKAIACAGEGDGGGVFNVAPDDAVPLSKAVRIAGGHHLALPWTLQRMVHSASALEYLRYSWTVSNDRIGRELGFHSAMSTVAVLGKIRPSVIQTAEPEPGFDPFGMDREYIDRRGRGLFRFLCDRYWRIETSGLEHIPRRGAALLVGMHRGFMPWDAVMVLHLLAREKGRYVRFLTHPGLLKGPFVAPFMARLGGVLACRGNADYVLNSGELLGVFPEGVQGAFALYRDAYRLLPFKRDGFAKMAMRHGVPIIPFVTVGSAEALPMFARIKSRRWTRYSDWPYVPITTFPLSPLPLPTKWHIRFLPPVYADWRTARPKAEDITQVKATSREVRMKMQAAIDDMLARRRSIFRGSIFMRHPPQPSPPTEGPSSAPPDS